MVEQNNLELTAAEISNLWTSYQSDTMAICGLKYFLSTLEDEEIRPVLEYALNISQQNIQDVTEILQDENYPIPVGFTDEDVHTSAPRLISDTLILLYVLHMGQFFLTEFSLMYSFSSRGDIAAFYSDCLNQVKTVVDKAKRLALKKGVYVRAPHLPTPDGVDFVKKQSFLAGWFGEQRPLLGTEITHLVYNAKRNALGEALTTAFSQVVDSKEVRRYMERGKQISTKHFEIFSSTLHKEHLSSAKNLTSEITDSTVSPFSDKLMMYHISVISASGIGQYGVSMSVSPRRDLGAMYTRLMAEIAQYSEDGANIMIDKGWMEQPPKAADREELAKEKR